MFELDVFMGKRVLKSSLFDGTDVISFFTTRDLPLKAGESDNLIEEVETNKKLICKCLDIPLKNLIIPQQTHSDNVEIIDLANESYLSCDSLITNESNIAVALNFADCVPLVFYDPIKKVAAAAHAGWRGTVSKIGPKTVEKMVINFDCQPENIIAVIGPAIGKCCFEAKEDVLNQIADSVDRKIKNIVSDMSADLKLANEAQLLAIGIKKIDVCEYCTSCQNELFFSYRKERGKTARHSALIMIKGEDT